MGKTRRIFSKFYIEYKKKFKVPINIIGKVIENNFTDGEFVELFEYMFPDLWFDLNKQYNYWHKQNNELIQYGKKSRYNFRKPSNFILDCSYYLRKGIRSNSNRINPSIEERENIINNQRSLSLKKLEKLEYQLFENLKYIQEVEPDYVCEYINEYHKRKDLHQKLEIIRELSKYKCERIIEFFYIVNSSTRNFSLKIESMNYIQFLKLPFQLRGKKKGKKSFVDNEFVINDSSPEILMKRLYVDELEKIKKFDVFLSHNSRDEDEIVEIYKELNSKGLVCYIDWVNDKFDLKREWCNASTASVIKERIKQSRIFLLVLTESVLQSQWCPWELGYADSLNKKIFILNNYTGDIPDFYKCYEESSLESIASYLKIED